MGSSPPPWNYLWKPGPYPKTEDERIAAAKKYGLIPEDYVPFPGDGTGLGDYPNLKPTTAGSRSYYHPWDWPDLKRNHGEPMAHDAKKNSDYATFDPISAAQKKFSPMWFLGACLFVTGL